MNILITNPGRKNYFIDFLIEIKKRYFRNLKIHISDADQNSSTFYMNKQIQTHITPKCHNKKKYINSIINLVKKKKINLLIPLTDLDLIILSEIKNKLKAFNCEALISDKKTIRMCENKISTFNFLNKNKLSTPLTWKKKKNKTNFPIITKEIFGNSSKGVKILKNNQDLKSVYLKNLIFQKYLKGEEYHIDILNDFNGNYLDHCSKLKLEMRDGETFKAKIVENSNLSELSKKISKAVKHVGNLDCDLILSNKKFFIIDFNPRFGGGYPFTHLAGKNYIMKIICNLLKKNYRIRKKAKLLTAMKSINLTVKNEKKNNFNL